MHINFPFTAKTLGALSTAYSFPRVNHPPST